MAMLPERFGEYLLVRRLGGGMAEVFLAVKLGDREGRSWVVKRPKLGERASGLAAQAILREAEVLGGVRSNELVRLEESGSMGGLPFVALEHHRGAALDAVLRSAAMPRAAAWTVGLDMLRALAALHAAKWVHCDVAPSNVLLDDAGEVRLADLGIASHAGAHRDAMMGKPGYVAPEVVAMKPAAAAEDLYAWALVVAEALSGKRLFAERDVAEAALRADANALVADVDPRGLLAACLARDPAQRPDAMTAIARLEELVPEAGSAEARGELAGLVTAAEGAASSGDGDESAAHAQAPGAVQGVTTRTHVDVEPLALDTLRASSIDRSRPVDRPRSKSGVIVAMVAIAAAGLVGGALVGRAVERRAQRARDTTLTLPSLPARTEYHLDGHVLLVTEEGRPIPISTGVHTISLAGPKREGKEYEFAVHEGDNVVIIALPVAIVQPADKRDPKKP